MWRRRSFLALLAGLAALIIATADPAAATTVTITATGDATPGTAFAPPDGTSRDLGISTPLSDQRRLWIFGDTFEPGAARRSAVHSNTAAVSAPGQPGTLHEAIDDNGHRHEFVPLDAPESAFNHGQRFRSVVPQRVYDSRTTPESVLGPGQSRDVTFPVPADIGGPVAAVFNLTGINTSGVGTDLEVTEPSAPEPPTTSSLNLLGHETAANLVTAALGPSATDPFGPLRTLRVRNSAGSVHVVVDLVGFEHRSTTVPATGDQFHAIAPTRVYDSIECAPARNLGGGEQATVVVRGSSCLAAGTVPPDATAVALNLTADGPGSARPTHLTAWAAGQAMPATSNLNLTSHDVRANMAIVPLPGNGAITLFNSEGSFRVIVDVLGYFTASAAGSPEQFVPIAPTRACDTREPTAPCAGVLGGGETRSVPLPRVPVPDGATAVALNVTTVFPSAPTHLTVWGGGARPVASNINAPPGSVRAAMVLAPLSAASTVEVFNNAGATHVIVDVVGFLATPSTTVGSCAQPSARLAVWPTSVVVVPGSVAPATDRVAVYYVRWLVCSAWQYLAQDVGVAIYDYTAGQPMTEPMLARRASLQASVDGSLPIGAHAKGGFVHDGYVYLYGCLTDDPPNTCFLRRAPAIADLADPSSYAYFEKVGEVVNWRPTAASQTPISFSPVGPVPSTAFPASDLSVQWLPFLGSSGSFAMMYEPRWDSGNKPVIVRTAPDPWGPWSEPVAKSGGTWPRDQPTVPGCDVTSLQVICRAFHLDAEASTSTSMWFSFYTMSDHKMKYSTLPIAVT